MVVLLGKHIAQVAGRVDDGRVIGSERRDVLVKANRKRARAPSRSRAAWDGSEGNALSQQPPQNWKKSDPRTWYRVRPLVGQSATVNARTKAAIDSARRLMHGSA